MTKEIELEIKKLALSEALKTTKQILNNNPEARGIQLCNNKEIAHAVTNIASIFENYLKN